MRIAAATAFKAHIRPASGLLHQTLSSSQLPGILALRRNSFGLQRSTQAAAGVLAINPVSN
jgi:hypothetical protein